MRSDLMKNKKLSRRKILGSAVGVTALAGGRGLLGAPVLAADDLVLCQSVHDPVLVSRARPRAPRFVP